VESLVAHFLNVGHGDCTFIELPSGRLMMIDISNSKSLPETDKEALAARKGISVREFAGAAGLRLGRRSWQEYYESLLVDPYDYYQDHFRGKPVFRYLQSHPDMDHMSGLHRFFWLEKVPLLNFLGRPAQQEARRGQLQLRTIQLPGLAHLPAAEGTTWPEEQRRHDGPPPRHQEHQARQRPVLDRRRHPGFLADARADRRVRRQRGVQRLLLRHQAQLRRPEHHPSRRCRGTSLEVNAR
jgi:hypothetical protein